MSYTYDPNNRLATKIDAKNQKVRYSYDVLGRLYQVQRYPATSGPEDLCQQVNYYHDSALLPGYTNVLGRLAGMQYTGGHCVGGSGGDTIWEVYGYTAPGQPSGKAFQVIRGSAAATLQGTWSYDNEGRITSVG